MDTDKLQQLIVRKRELLARDTFSHRAFNRCEDMSDEMKNCYVEYLTERMENAELDNRVMKLALEDLTKELSRSNQLLEKLNELQSLLEEERNSRKSLKRENTKLKELLGDAELKTDRHKNAGRQVCLSHVRAKFVKAWMEGMTRGLMYSLSI